MLVRPHLVLTWVCMLSVLGIQTACTSRTGYEVGEQNSRPRQEGDGDTPSPIAFVGECHANRYQENATWISVTRPPGLDVDDLLLAWVSRQGSSTVTTASGFALHDSGISGDNYQDEIYCKIATSSDVSASTFRFDFSSPSDDVFLAIAVYRNVHLSAPVSDFRYNTGQSSTWTWLGAEVAFPSSLSVFMGTGWCAPPLPSGTTNRFWDADWDARWSDRIEPNPGPMADISEPAGCNNHWGTSVVVLRPQL